MLDKCASAMIKLFHDGGPYHIETSPLIYRANQWSGFYIIGNSVMKDLTKRNQERNNAQKLKFPIKDFFSKCDQIRRKLWIWSPLLKKSLMEKFIFYAVRS